MQSTDKLAEAEYFLRALLRIEDKMDEFDYNLSAFLGASHSVMDIMLYDFDELFDLGFSRSEKFTPRDFQVASRAMGKSEALRFLEWWNAKTKALAKNPIWLKRHFIVHRGYPEMEVFRTVNVSGSAVDTSFIESLAGVT